MPSPQDLSTLLPLLTCPECRSAAGLSLQESTPGESRLWQTMLREISPPQQKITCRACSRSYPVTADGIPVLWSQALEQTFQSLEDDVDAALARGTATKLLPNPTRTNRQPMPMKSPKKPKKPK